MNEPLENNKIYKKAVDLAFERLGQNSKDFNFVRSSNDIRKEFKNITIKDITTAIKNGGLGKYGNTFRLTEQIICIWIRTYLGSKTATYSLKNSNKYRGDIIVSCGGKMDKI